jgi:3-oxoacyl-[acyl-carrier-protein] synthase-1
MPSFDSGAVITGIGMRTALGNSAGQTCAAVRAGLNRFAVWPHFTAAGEDEDGEVGQLAAAVDPPTGDEPWQAKAAALLLQPMHEALFHAGLGDFAALRHNGLAPLVYLATPYVSEASEPGDEKAGEGDIPDDGDEPLPASAEERYRAFLDETRALVEELIPLHGLAGFPAAHAGGLAAMAQAVADLNAGRARVALVCGVDSLLDSNRLASLFESGCLLGGRQGSGLIPGEAAACLVVERADQARQRGARPLATLGPVALGRDPHPLGADVPVDGSALSDVFRNAVESSGGGKLFGEVLIDLTGERARFLEWATVETRCLHAVPKPWLLEHPADCLGDVGAAFGPLAAGLAARACERGYAHGRGVAICASSPRGERAVATLFPCPFQPTGA